MVLLYSYEEVPDRVFVVAMHERPVCLCASVSVGVTAPSSRTGP